MDYLVEWDVCPLRHSFNFFDIFRKFIFTQVQISLVEFLPCNGFIFWEERLEKVVGFGKVVFDERSELASLQTCAFIHN